MPHSVFFRFIFPSLLAMLIFIAAPIVSVIVQSLHIEHSQVLVQVESCDPFSGCKKATSVDAVATAKLRAEAPLGRFNGLGTYFDRSHLASAEVATAWRESPDLRGFGDRLMSLPFYRAMAFTLTYTFVVTPLVVVLGMMIALGINGLPAICKGPTIFVSLLPMLVTPLIGSMVLFWMIDARGIIGSSLQTLTGDPNLSLKASPALTWVTLIVYGVWHSAPFAFITFYAGLQSVSSDTLEAAMIDARGIIGSSLQTLTGDPNLSLKASPALTWVTLIVYGVWHSAPFAFITFYAGLQSVSSDTLEAAMIDGATRWERLRYVVIPHMAPLVVFVMLIQLMDNFRVFEPIVGFSAAANASSLSYNIYNDLAQASPNFGSAAATSMLTVLGVAILLIPVLVRTWRDFNSRRL